MVRFDGERFTLFDESNTPGLTSSGVEALFEDSRGDLWVGTTRAGVVWLRNGQAISSGIGRDSKALVSGFCEDAGGAVWVLLTNGQLWRYQNGATNVFQLPDEQATDYRGLIAEASGPVWIGTDRQLTAVDWRAATSTANLPITQTIPFLKLDFLLASHNGGYWRLAGRIQKWKADRDGPELDFGLYPWGFTSSWQLARFNTACEDREGNLVVGTLGAGIYWFDPNGEANHLCSTNQGLSNDFILALRVDQQGDLWVGTDGGGLNRVKRAVFDVLDSSRKLVVQSVSADAKGGLWISYNGIPLTYWKDGVERRVGSQVRTAFVDRQQRVWAGTWGAGLLRVETNRLIGFVEVPGFDRSLQQISAIHQDRRGWIWVGSQRGLARWDETEWTTFTTSDGLSGDHIRAIADAPDGTVWIGTEDSGLNRWRNGEFTAFRKQTNGLPSDNISALYVDGEGVLWVGTDGAGLARLDQGKWARFTRRDGLVGNSIGYILEDAQGNLWLGSNAGLMRAAKQALNAFARGETNVVPCRVYGRPDGLPIRECSSGTQPGPSRSADGRLWFPTIQGLASVNPADLKPNPHPPPVRIETVLVDGQPWAITSLPNQPAGTGSVVVPAGREQVEIQYTSLNLAAPERARFKYRLEGHETDWIEAGNSRTVRYTKLPFAKYRFHVTACNEDGVWNENGATLALTITAPIWRTWWFLTALTLALLGGLAGVVHYLSTQRLQRQVALLREREALERERSRIARDIHDQLGANLTQVALLGELVESDKEVPGEVEAHARQISQTARETTRVLDEIVWAVNPANDTLDGLVTYVCKHTQEYLSVAGLHCRFDVPGQLPATPIPPEVRHNVFLACKEAVTNIVRHAKASAVWIRLRPGAPGWILEIEDNGRGMAGLDEESASTRNGLRNMRNRMREIGGDFAFAPAPEGGTLVRFTLPIGRDREYGNHSLHR